MLVLFLLHAAIAINITIFENVQIEFDSKCPEFFLLQSDSDYLYFYQKNGYFELWHMQGANYSIYTSPWTEILIFQWPDKIINDKAMDLVLHEGSLTSPAVFDTESIMCDIKGMIGGSLFYIEAPCESIKCPPSDTWKVNLLGFCVGLLILFIFGATIPTIQPDISHLFSRILRRYSSTSLGPETSL